MKIGYAWNSNNCDLFFPLRHDFVHFEFIRMRMRHLFVGALILPRTISYRWRLRLNGKKLHLSKTAFD